MSRLRACRGRAAYKTGRRSPLAWFLPELGGSLIEEDKEKRVTQAVGTIEQRKSRKEGQLGRDGSFRAVAEMEQRERRVRGGMGKASTSSTNPRELHA